MGDIVIVAYRPKPGCEAALADLARDHVPHLRRLGLATGREPVLMCTASGTIVECFEWRGGGAEAAHAMPEIHSLWQHYAQLCDYVPLNELPEAATLFATFQPL